MSKSINGLRAQKSAQARFGLLGTAAQAGVDVAKAKRSTWLITDHVLTAQGFRISAD
jgi:hypothetical protein